MDDGRDDDIFTRGESFESRGHVDRAAEIIQTFVQGNGDAGACMDAYFELERAHAALWIAQSLLRFQDCAQCARRTTKDGHDGVANGFDKRAVFRCYRLAQDIEVIHDAAECRSISYLTIKPRRVFEVCEKESQASDGDLFARSQRFVAEQVAE